MLGRRGRLRIARARQLHSFHCVFFLPFPCQTSSQAHSTEWKSISYRSECGFSKWVASARYLSKERNGEERGKRVCQEKER